MDQREVNFYNGTVDNLKSIAKSLKRIADFCDRMEGMIKEERGVKEESAKDISMLSKDVGISYSLENLKSVRDALIGYSNRLREVPLSFFYGLVGLDSETAPKNRGWRSLAEDDVRIIPLPNGAYKLILPPIVWID